MTEGREPANAVEANLANWAASRFEKLPVAGLLARSPVAHKWKAPFRSMILREVAFWRQHDLMEQSYALYEQGHLLGARILLRSGFETSAILIYLNLLTQQVLDGKLSFHVFAEKTSRLLLGTRNNEDMPQAINVVTLLEKCDKRYPGMMRVYSELCETAHPNYEGLMQGYTVTDYGEYETTFTNRWAELHSKRHLDMMMLNIEPFHYEYDHVWANAFEPLEKWIEDNDDMLEATKNDPLPA